MNYVFDIDGTLSFNGVSIDQEIISALLKLQEEGGEIIFASARPIRDMMEIVPKEFKDSMWIGGNGAFTKTDKGIDAQQLAKEVHEPILAHVEKNDYDYMIDSDWDFAFKGDLNGAFYPQVNSHLAKHLPLSELKTINKILIFEPSAETIEFLKKQDVVLTQHSREHLIDVSPKNCSKSNAIRSLGIVEYVAFGNDANDVPMFKDSIRSYCVGDSDYAKHATFTIEKSDVAKTILEQINLL
ncbi:HAD-IIB family hydrolase [Erysipelothrix inopinata]|uniref:HAD-IIB family hydrolase n=1 Tax=Erysipelothrix inopinata TaxID=225084 RepID=A0A7G9RW41_9FIRM|nr:HAD-IIB family hydrolase [Erysipelothrix inopinata]QNN59816.1 HAD-IIB family hydrolase [Erysipelothrix inopinata]